MQLIDLTQFKTTNQNSALNPASPLQHYNWLNLTRHQCTQKLQHTKRDYIDFARWLAIPSLNIMLVFKNGVCCHIEQDLIK